MGALCGSCSAPIEWAVTEKGKRIPLDPEPVENGNIEVVLQDRGDGSKRKLALKVGVGDGDRVSHFATCPNAHKHRKKDRKARAAA